jgi:cytoskeleton protein RodZ
VFEIGSSLRDARMRQQLELSQVERETRIRARYLAALEEERFDVLPAPAYAKGFLRTYADYLGLDGQQFVDEYNSRFGQAEEPSAVPAVRIRRRRPGLDPRLLVVPVAAGLALLVWRLSTSGDHHTAFVPPPPTRTTKARAPEPQRVRSTPKTLRVVFTAARGPCWLSVRIGSETGKVVYERTLEEGGTARFVARRLWIRFGAPWNLDATLNGQRVRLPNATGNVVARPAGLATAP